MVQHSSQSDQTIGRPNSFRAIIREAVFADFTNQFNLNNGLSGWNQEPLDYVVHRTRSSKVALTALRGLVLGTSCTLALVAEDRRRRINNAVNVIETSKKLKASKHYHGGGAGLALAVEGEAEPLPFPYEPTAKLTAKTQRKWTERAKKEFLPRQKIFQQLR